MPQGSIESRRGVVDLCSRHVSVFKVKERFLGGRGANYAQLLDIELANPSGPSRAPLLFATGALVATDFPGASRVNVAGRNPITQGIGSGSAGSSFATRMRIAGFDQIVVLGQSAEPVYLVVESEHIAIHDAEEAWGLGILDADRLFRTEKGENIATALIGPAGEAGCVSAAILFDASRAVGRCGLGAVMGLKRLKGIIVVADTGKLKAEDNYAYQEILRVTQKAVNSALQLHDIRSNGTIGASPNLREPLYNHRKSVLAPEERQALRPDAFNAFLDRQYGCPNCSVKCGRSFRVNTGPFAGAYSSGLHANTVTDFGTRLGIFKPDAIIAAHGVCNNLGLDIDNASGVIAWAIEAFEQGALTLADTQGLELAWGDTTSMLKLLSKIAYRDGIGDLLCRGCAKASSILGQDSGRYCIAVKGQELMELLRPYKGWALGVVVSERGGGHTRGAPICELSGVIPARICERAGLAARSLPANSYDGKPEIVVYYERLHAILDSLGVCYMISDWASPELPSFAELARALSAVVGMEFTAEQLKLLGEQIHTLGKLINVMYIGMDRSRDYPPDRLSTEALEEGEILCRADWDKMLDRYYALHNWDVRTSLPTRATLRELRLGEFAGLV